MVDLGMLNLVILERSLADLFIFQVYILPFESFCLNQKLIQSTFVPHTENSSFCYRSQTHKVVVAQTRAQIRVVFRMGMDGEIGGGGVGGRGGHI